MSNNFDYRGREMTGERVAYDLSSPFHAFCLGLCLERAWGRILFYRGTDGSFSIIKDRKFKAPLTFINKSFEACIEDMAQEEGILEEASAEFLHAETKIERAGDKVRRL